VRLPLRIEGKIDDRALVGDGEVVARVLRFGLSWWYPRGGGTWQILIPIGIIDRRAKSKGFHPVLDWGLMAAVVASISATVLLRNRPRR
jgi:hypothetical protein